MNGFSDGLSTHAHAHRTTVSRQVAQLRRGGKLAYNERTNVQDVKRQDIAVPSQSDEIERERESPHQHGYFYRQTGDIFCTASRQIRQLTKHHLQVFGASLTSTKSWIHTSSSAANSYTLYVTLSTYGIHLFCLYSTGLRQVHWTRTHRASSQTDYKTG